jgi:hypothetical protein
VVSGIPEFRSEAYISLSRQNPHVVCPQTSQMKAAEKKRAQQILHISALHRLPSLEIRASGPGDIMRYGTTPTTPYQLWARGSENVVTQHYTPTLRAEAVERSYFSYTRDIDLMDYLESVQSHSSLQISPKNFLITMVRVTSTLKNLARSFNCISDLREELKIKGRKQTCYGGKSPITPFHVANHFAGGYGRLEADGAFPTALGTITPDGKGGQVIHPNVSTHTYHHPLTNPPPSISSNTAQSPSVNSPARKAFQTASSFTTSPTTSNRSQSK